jgi:hypothetical protein
MCGGSCSSMLAAMDGNYVSISLELRPEDRSFTGCATTSDGSEREFSGWLGLMSAIDALLYEEEPKEDQ